MKKLYQPILDFAAKGWWQKLVVVSALVAGISAADHFLGNGNGVSQVLEVIEQAVDAPAVSPTTV